MRERKEEGKAAGRSDSLTQRDERSVQIGEERTIRKAQKARDGREEKEGREKGRAMWGGLEDAGYGIKDRDMGEVVRDRGRAAGIIRLV